MEKDNEPRRPIHRSHPSHDAEARGNGCGDDEVDDALVVDRLVGYTDAVLAGREPEEKAPAALATTIRQLAARAEVARGGTGHGADEHLHPVRLRWLKAAVMAAWDREHGISAQHADLAHHAEVAPPSGPVSCAHEDRPMSGWMRARLAVEARLRSVSRTMVRQPAWGAALALLLVAFGLLLLVPLGVEPAPGTAVGPVGTGVWIGLGVLTVAAAVVIWGVGRRRR